LRVRLIVIKIFSTNNIYAKTVHKEQSSLQELHPITSARWFEGARKAPPTRYGAEPRKLYSFNSIFIDKKAHL